MLKFEHLCFERLWCSDSIEEPIHHFPYLEDDYLDSCWRCPSFLDPDTFSESPGGIDEFVKQLDFEAVLESTPDKVPECHSPTPSQPSLLNTSLIPPPNLPVPFCDRITRQYPRERPTRNPRPLHQHQHPKVTQPIPQQEQKWQQASHPLPVRHPFQTSVAPPPRVAQSHPPKSYTVSQTTKANQVGYTPYATVSEAVDALRQKQRAEYRSLIFTNTPFKHTPSPAPPNVQKGLSPETHNHAAAAAANDDNDTTVTTVPPQPTTSLPAQRSTSKESFVTFIVNGTLLRLPNEQDGHSRSSHPPLPPSSLPAPAPVALEPPSPDLRRAEEDAKEILKKPAILQEPPSKSQSNTLRLTGFARDIPIYDRCGTDYASALLRKEVLIAFNDSPLSLHHDFILSQLHPLFERECDTEQLMNTPFFLELLRSGHMLIPFQATHGYPLPECEIALLPFRSVPNSKVLLYSFAHVDVFKAMLYTKKQICVRNIIISAWSTLREFQQCNRKKIKHDDWFSQYIRQTEMFVFDLTDDRPYHEVRPLTRVQLAYIILYYSIHQLPEKIDASSLSQEASSSAEHMHMPSHQQSTCDYSQQELQAQQQQWEQQRLEQQRLEQQRLLQERLVEQRLEQQRLQLLQLQQQNLQLELQLRQQEQQLLLHQQQQQKRHHHHHQQKQQEQEQKQLPQPAQLVQQSPQTPLTALVQHVNEIVKQSSVEAPQQPEPPAASRKRKSARPPVLDECNIAVDGTDAKNKRHQGMDQEEKGPPAAIVSAEPVVETSKRQSRRARSQEQKRPDDSEESDAGKPMLNAKRKHSSTGAVEDGQWKKRQQQDPKKFAKLPPKYN